MTSSSARRRRSPPSPPTGSRRWSERRPPAVAWVETVSASFRARHDSAHRDDAERVLDSLERLREELRDLLPHTPGELTVVLHPGALSLAMANPLLPVRWLLTA